MPIRKREKKIKSLEKQYAELFRGLNFVALPEEGSLEQPSPLMIVPSLTTYGAYEEPVVG